MNGEGFPQQPPQNPNIPLHQPDVMPQYGPHMSGTEFGGPSTTGAHSVESHLTQPPGTEVMRPALDSEPIGYDPISPAERTQQALGALHVGESTVVWKPGEGNRRVTLIGAKNGKLKYHWEPVRSAQQPHPQTRPLAPPAQPWQPAPPRASLPPAHIGPIGGADFGPRGSQSPQEVAPYAQSPYDTRGNQPPEAHPNAGPDYEQTFVDEQDDLSDVDEAFAQPLVSRRTNKPPEQATEPDKTQQVADVEAPPVEKLDPKTIQETDDADEDFGGKSVLVHRSSDRRADPRPQANPAGDYGQSQDLVDRIKRGEAEPVAGMDPENVPDTTATRRSKAQPGAAAAVEHAEKTGAAEQPSAGQPERRPRGADDDEEVPQHIDEIIPGVVPEGQEPDIDLGGGPSRRYRR